MKIVCTNCGAKYSIADEKVAGKSFKIRCRKCSSAIVVQGGLSEVPNQRPRTYSDGPTSFDASASGLATMWHIVIGGEQQGPFAFDHLARLFSERQIGWDDFVWCEDFDDWKVIREVSELSDLLQRFGGASAPAANAGDSGEMGDDPFSGPGDQLSSEPIDNVRTVVADTVREVAPADSFAGASAKRNYANPQPAAARAQASFDSADAKSTPSPADARIGKLTGQRNENSVLFSLANLQALATGGDNRSSGAVNASLAAKPAGGASGDASGLIDIRSLATASKRSSTALGSTNGHRRDVDDLLAIGGSIGGLSSPLTAPVLGPVVEREKSSKLPLIAVIGTSLLLGIAGIVAVIILLTRQTQPSSTAPSATGEQVPGGIKDTGVAAVGKQLAGSTAQPEGDPGSEGVNRGNPTPSVDQRAADPRGTAGERDRRETRRAHSAGDSKTGIRAARPTDAVAGAEEPTPKKASESKPSGDIDSLLAEAIGGGGKRSPAKDKPIETKATPSAASGSDDLPEVPSRSDVMQALRSVQDAVKACGNGQHGVASTAIVVRGSNGTVSDANVSGAFAGTPVASCIGRAVKKAQFPRFKRSTLSVTFPYSL